MAEQQKPPSWWTSVPGLLTAATGFVAALSGLVAGLNQLGVFRRDQPVARVEVTAAAPRESAEAEPEEHTATAAPDSQPTARTPAPAPRVPVARPVAPPLVRPADPAPASHADTLTRGHVPVDDTTPAVDSGDGGRAAAPMTALPAGTTLELAAAARVCAPPSGLRSFTALLVAPVRVGRTVGLPGGTPAVLRIRRDESPSGLRVRLDSILLRGSAVAVRRSELTVPRGSATDGCLRPGARVRARLQAPLALPGP